MANINIYPQILDGWQKLTGITVDSDTFLECQNALGPLDTCFAIVGIKIATEKIKISSF